MPGPDRSGKPRLASPQPSARARAALALLAALALPAALRVHAARQACVVSAPFTEAGGGRVAASAMEPACTPRGDALDCPPHAASLAESTVTLATVRDPRAAQGP